MTRLFGSLLPVEMLALWLADSLLSFIVIYLLLLPSGASVMGAAGLHPATANLAAVLAVTIGLTALAIGLYRPEICLRARRLLVNTLAAGVAAFPAILAACLAFGFDVAHLMGSDRLGLGRVLMAWLACLLATRAAFSIVCHHGLLDRPVLLIGSGARAARARAALTGEARGFFRLAASVPPADAPSAPQVRMGGRRRIWGIVVAGPVDAALPDAEVQRWRAAGVRVLSDAEFEEQHLGRIDLETLRPGEFRAAVRPPDRPVDAFLRRLFDVVISLAVLALTAPLLLLTALAIKLDDSGPIFYRQERVGLSGRPFMLLKFRSMRVDAEAGSGPTWAANDDPRVTRAGRFIRRLRIDEVPQIFNVLQGTMSFVGPRPERPHFVRQLEAVLPGYRDRSVVKPGITGWAQVNFPYAASVEDARIKLGYDLYYIKHRSLMLDLSILLATVRVILFQEGAR